MVVIDGESTAAPDLSLSKALIDLHSRGLPHRVSYCAATSCVCVCVRACVRARVPVLSFFEDSDVHFD